MKDDYLKSLISVLPDLPGVYQFYNNKQQIIYIGKAKKLKKRVSSYFTKIHDSAKTRILVRKIADIKHIVVNSEVDALLLENNLIKKYQPKYNVMLKDDKSYPWICVKNERFPRVFYTRKVIRDGSVYYGPYTSIRMVRTIIDLFKRLFKLRTCNLNLSQENIENKKHKVCLEYHIGNCLAPCIGEQSAEDYDKNIAQIHKILKGNIQSVKAYLKEKMREYAADYEYERAQQIKEKIDMVNSYQSKSMIVNPSISNVDVFSIVDDSKYAYINFLKVVSGAIIQAHSAEIKKKLNESKEELLNYAITDIRNRFHSNSKEIIVPFEMEFPIENVNFIIPQRGDKRKLLDLSLRNAKFFRQERLKQFEKVNPKRHADRIMTTLQNDLHLKEKPAHIECFDNSNIQGHFPVAACVVFRDAKPAKKEYRHYNVKTVEGPDDFSSMKEIVYRRYKRLLEDEKDLPQLIVIDGGKGQLSAALQSLDELNLRGKIAIIGIAKKLEEIYFPGDSVPLYLDKNSESLKVIQFIRDEAHRFGITFHRNKRSKKFVHSELNEINGVGEKTIQKLLHKFKSVKKIKEAEYNELSETIGKSKANIVFNYFHPKSNISS